MGRAVADDTLLDRARALREEYLAEAVASVHSSLAAFREATETSKGALHQQQQLQGMRFTAELCVCFTNSCVLCVVAW